MDNIKPTYEYYLFLCDETWSEASKSIMYKGLWKQEQNRLYFEKYNLAKEYSFFKNYNKQVMFASCFKIFEDDIAQAIKINANQISKHSFLFLTEKPICFNTEDIFKALNISESKLGGNDWENLRKFSEIHKIVPIQKWEDGIEISLRFFLHDNIQILKY